MRKIGIIINKTDPKRITFFWEFTSKSPIQCGIASIIKNNCQMTEECHDVEMATVQYS